MEGTPLTKSHLVEKLLYLQSFEELQQVVQTCVLVTDELLTDHLMFLLQGFVRLIGLLEKLLRNT